MESSEPRALLGVIIIIAFPVFFVGMWCFVNVLLATVSGWRAMLGSYRCPEGLTGASLPSGWVNRVGVASYKGILTFEATPQGLIVRVSRLFPFHPALLIPWASLRLNRNGGFMHAGEMEVAGGSTFRLNNDALTAIEGALAQSQPRAPWSGAR